jgi:phenylalanyl-tRNA synthetase beta chain
MGIIDFFKKLFFSSSLSVKTFPGVVAAKVAGLEKHPNADRLRIIKLDIGDRIVEPVVCGAFNFGEGDIVALALPRCSSRIA